MRSLAVLAVPALFGLWSVTGVQAQLCGAGEELPEGEAADRAPLIAGLGSHEHTILTTSAMTQRLFNQGLIMHYAFNHAEAVRSFRNAAALDPDAVMPVIGEALSLGPHINWGMDDDKVPQAWAAVQKAKAMVGSSSPRERDYVAALEARYTPTPVEDRSANDLAYAEAMRKVAQTYPDDLTASVLFAEAAMCVSPWDYWLPNDEPKPMIAEAIAALERVLERDPENPGANHLYIHIMEQSPAPEKALACADRLRDLVPSAGHLVHMPGHIYLRLGLYAEASRCNEVAIEADNTYIAQCNAQGFYPLAYAPHNEHFLWFTSLIEGRAARSLELAQQISASITDEHIEADRLRPLHWFTLVRLGDFAEMLQQSRPEERLVFATGMWRHAAGLAHAGGGSLDEAQQLSDELDAFIESDEGKAFELPSFYGHRQLQIAGLVLHAAIASKRGDTEHAIAFLKDAIAIQDGLPYMEPPYWYFPVRQQLGGLLLKNQQHAQAEAVFREDLIENPANGWSLWGLQQALKGQGNQAAAAEVERQFRFAWVRADLKAPVLWPY